MNQDILANENASTLSFNHILSLDLPYSALPGILNTKIGNGSVIYVYRKTIRVALSWILNWMAAMSLLLTLTNMTWMLIPVDGFQGCTLCSSKFSDLLYGKLFRSFRYSKLKRSERFNRLIHCFQKLD